MKKDESKIVIGDAKYCRKDKGRLQKFMDRETADI